MANECPKCQTNNPEDSKFCKECGTSFPGVDEVFHTKTLETPTEELKRGSVFAGRYEIIEELGKGGMGRVYRVEDKKVKEDVALKLIKPEIAADKKIIERFTNELRTARRIGHRNVGRMYDIGDEKGSHFITMEYVSGQDLKGLIRQSKRLAVPTAVTIAKEICDGLAEAHRLGVIHRDLKPSNIMIDKEGAARIMDFGIARTVKEKGITGSGVMIGTPEYMSPEQVEAKEVDQRSDIYSLGIIMYEMLTGRLPFEADTPFAVGVKHKSEIPKDPRELNPQIPDDLSGVILKCLEKDKENRYQSAGYVRSELEKIEQGLPTTDRVIPERKAITSKEITVKFTPKKLFIPAAAVVVLVAAGLFLLLRPKGPSLDPNRVVVALFENKTGATEYENLGHMATNLITQGLAQTGLVSVSSIPDPEAFLSVKEGQDPVKLLARETQAGKVVTGSYYLEENALQFQAQVQDGHDGKIVATIEPIRGSVEEPIILIESLRERVMGALATVLDEIVVETMGSSGENPYVPTYEAFKEYIIGHRFFLDGPYSKAIEHYNQAITLDPDYVLPHLELHSAYHNSGRLQEAEEISKKIYSIRHKLSPWEASWWEYIDKWIDGDLDAQYQLIRKSVDLNPNSGSLYNLGLCAMRINRPGEAVKVLNQTDPESPLMKDWEALWSIYTHSYHMLGNHKKELKVAKLARKQYPDQRRTLWFEMRALIAQGKTARVEELLDEGSRLPPQAGYSDGILSAYAGWYFLLYSDRDKALEMAENAVQFFRNLPEKEAQTVTNRAWLAFCLYTLERWEESKSLYEDLLEERPESSSYLGRMGLIAARLGDEQEAARISTLLENHPGRYLRGNHTLHRARIATALGKKEEAVRLLREAVSQGVSYSALYDDIYLLDFKDYPPFQEFMKPKG